MLVTRHHRGSAAVITLDSPANRNALSATLVDELAQHLAAAHHRTPESEALALLEERLGAAAPPSSQAELLADLKRRSFVPPAGTPDGVELLREDRAR